MGAKTGTKGSGRSRLSGRSMLVSLTVAARELGIPYSSLREVLLRGELQHVRLSGRGRYWVKRSDLERFIEHSTVQGVH